MHVTVYVMALLEETAMLLDETALLELLAALLLDETAALELLRATPVLAPTNVVTLCAGSSAVKLPFERLIAATFAIFPDEVVLLPVTVATVPLLMVNCWLTADVVLLIATITTLSALLYADTYTFVAGVLVASTLI